VLREFEAAGLEYVLIGATAMAFHGLVRATEDLDFFIRATPDSMALPQKSGVALGVGSVSPAVAGGWMMNYDMLRI
jgi:hypothetical protein